MLKIYKDNITDRNKEFERLTYKSQDEIKKYVKSRIHKPICGDGFVFHKGTFPVLLCAHMDTVHEKRINTLVYANGTLSSPQGIGGDDRCGIYMILKILKRYDCSVVFLEDEEKGCIGAKKFAKSKICEELKKTGGLKYIIEFDRKGNNHAVTYDCGNDEFDSFITKEFFKKEYGTCSDISYIAPELGIAAVNLSCGYYEEHSLLEWVNLEEMETIIREAIKILKRTSSIDKPFKYILKKQYPSYGYYSGRYNYYDYEYDDYESYYRYKNKSFKFVYKGNSGDATLSSTIYESSKAEAFMKFFTIHKTLCYENIVSITEC